MATQKLNIDIIARDKSKRALNTLQSSLGRLKQSIFNVRNAFIGIGAGFVIRNLVNTGKELENLQVRLRFLLKDTNEGAKAFDNMVKFASKVPFSLEEIQKGSGILATVTDNAEDLQKMLEITGNVAAVTGLDFRTTAEQIQRSFSAGIGAADLFREKGVRNMLGFKAGATVSIEETIQAFEKVFSRGGRFGKATDELAETFEGTLSMIGDKVFSFKRVLLEAGFFAELKNQFGDLNEFLEKNGKQVDAIAKKIGKGLAIAFKNLAEAVIFVKDNVDKFALALGALIAMKVASFFYGIVTAINAMTFAMRGFNLATKKNIIFGSIMVFASAMGFLIKKFKEFKGELDSQEDTIESLNAKIEKWQKTVNSQRANPKAKKLALENIAIAKEKIKELQKENAELILSYTTHMRTHQISKSMNNTQKANTEEVKKQHQAYKNIHEAHLQFKKQVEVQNTLQMQVWQKLKDQNAQWSLSDEIVGAINNGVQGFSKMLAEAVVYGKKINMSFKELAQGLLVDILAKMIERIALVMIEEFILNKIITKDKDKLAMEKAITKEKKKQVFYQSILMSMGGGSGGGLKLFASGGSVRKGQPTIVGERGPEVFVPNSTGQIQQNARGTGGGNVNVNFNIEAIDSNSFNDVLVENRGIITSIINNALNEKGRRELV